MTQQDTTVKHYSRAIKLCPNRLRDITNPPEYDPRLDTPT